MLADDPKILLDPFARDFSGSTDEELLKTNEHPLAHMGRTQFALRSRFAEDELTQAIGKGAEQYVILGAGLDSFAYRRPDLMRSLDVYEVDHPASQAWKRERLVDLRIPKPSGLHYTPIDFEHETLTQGLVAAGLDCSKATFSSWLGVTQYLTRDAVLRTLQEIASLSVNRSTLVSQFIPPASALSEGDGQLVTTLAATSAHSGEPWLSYFTSTEMEDVLREAGFTAVTHFGLEAAYDRYLRGRSDGLRLPGYFRMVTATTG
jgi:methyltransferase (TIGR00027 family)